MPKESVYESGDEAEQSRTGFKSVEVTWGKDQAHVQVGTRFQGAPFRFETAHAEEPGPFESLHATLTNRGQVNDLIRVLRRARDQAFGRDE